MQFVVVGTGYTGARVAAALENAIGISRRRPPGFPPKRFYVRDLDSETAAPVDTKTPCSIVYTIPPAPDSPDDRRLSRLLHALQPSPRRMVYLSTSGVYGDRQGSPTNESVMPAPTNARAQRRLAAEQQLLKYCRHNDCDAVILRVPGIYGPGRLGLGRIQSGSPVITESEANPGNRIHVDDLVRCCLAALNRETPAGVYNVGDGDNRSSSWFATTVAELAGLAPPPLVSRDAAEATFSTVRLSFLRESRRLDVTKMRNTLRVVPRYSNPEDGIQASLVEEQSPQD